MKISPFLGERCVLGGTAIKSGCGVRNCHSFLSFGANWDGHRALENRRSKYCI